MHRLTSSQYLSASDVIVNDVIVISGAHVEGFLFADDKTVVETDATRPRQLRIDDSPLESATSIGEPVRHLLISTAIHILHDCSHTA